jgi:hypothetical protein
MPNHSFFTPIDLKTYCRPILTICKVFLLLKYVIIFNENEIFMSERSLDSLIEKIKKSGREGYWIFT